MVSLHQVMNGMVRKPISIPEWTQAYPETEIDVYLSVDPLLADLFKAMETAKKQYNNLKKKNGLYEPMTEVARDMADSTQSAFDTRLLELRADRELRKNVRRLLLKARLEAERERREQSALYKARMLLFFSNKRAETLRERENQRNKDFILFVFWLFFFAMEQTNLAARLAVDFTMATEKRGDKQAA